MIWEACDKALLLLRHRSHRHSSYFYGRCVVPPPFNSAGARFLFRKVLAVWRTVQGFNCKNEKSRYIDSTKSGKAFLLLAQFMLNYVTALYNKASLRALPGVPLAGKPPAKTLFQKINRSSVCYSIVMSPKTQYNIIANKCFIVTHVVK